MSEFRVTVEDLDAGEQQSMIVHSGDYVLIPFAPCYLHHTQANANGTVVVTLKDRRPQGNARDEPVVPDPRIQRALIELLRGGQTPDDRCRAAIRALTDGDDDAVHRALARKPTDA